MVKLPVPRTRVTGSSKSLNSAGYTKINISLVYKVQLRLTICPARATAFVGSVTRYPSHPAIKSSPVVKNLSSKANTGQESRDFADKRFLIGHCDTTGWVEMEERAREEYTACLIDVWPLMVNRRRPRATTTVVVFGLPKIVVPFILLYSYTELCYARWG